MNKEWNKSCFLKITWQDLKFTLPPLLRVSIFSKYSGQIYMGQFSFVLKVPQCAIIVATDEAVINYTHFRFPTSEFYT